MTLERRENRTLRGAGLVLFYGALILVVVWLGCSSDTTPPGSPSELNITTAYDDNTPAFTWNAAADQGSAVSHYLARIDAGSWTKLGNVTTLNWGSPVSDGSHSFEVRAVDKHGNEGVPASLTFLVDTTPPPKPSLVSPADAYCTNDATPSFGWGSVSDASGVTYRLQISDNDTDFSSPCLNMRGAKNAEYTLTEYLALADGEYYWRVCAVDGVGQESEWTDPRTFTVDNVAPGVCSLIYQADGHYTSDNTPHLDWSNVTDNSPVHYQLEMDSSSSFSAPVLVKDLLTGSWYIPAPEEALSDGTYYWRVRAVDAAGNEGDWTEAWSLNIDTMPPDMVELSSPGDGTSTADSTPLLEWASVTDASPVHYLLEVDDDPDFFSPEVSKTWVTGSGYAVAAGEALANGTYYWRVKAADAANNESDWTAVWSFTVG